MEKTFLICLVYAFAINTSVLSINDGSRNVSIEYAADDGNLWEGSGNITIWCNADCNPSCDRYQIYHNDTLKDTSKEIKITKTLENSGRYYCSASNSGGQGYTQSRNVANITIKFSDGPRNVRIEYDDDDDDDDDGDLWEGSGYITNRCNADCYPPCDRYQIYHNDILKDTSKEIKITKTRENSGHYYCSASNSGGQDYAQSKNVINITIKYGARNVSIDFIHNGNLWEGSGNITIRCNADCYPPCDRYQIYHNNSPKFMFKETSIVKARENSGQYHCSASNSLKPGYVRSSNKADITIKYPPGVVSITPDKNTFYCKKDGKPYVDVVCKADCLPQCTYKWEREIYAGYNPLFTTGYSLFATKNICSRWPRSRYRCRCIASNDNRYSYSKWITVEIKDGPEHITITSSGTPIENSPFNLTCSANCLHGCTSYMWYFNRKRLHNQTLKFHRLSKAENGEYICFIQDYFGITSKSYSLNVQCSLCITSFSNVSDDKGFKIGDHLEINVNFIANPKANVSWTFIPWNDHKSQVVKVEQNQENSTKLWIQSLDMKEYGIYQLELVNRFGKETKAFYVQGPPHAPGGLNVSCSGGSAIVTWRSGFSGGTQLKFLISYTADLTSSKIHHLRLENVSILNQSLSTRVHDLPLGSYVFWLRAENKFGSATSPNVTVNCAGLNPVIGSDADILRRIYIYGAVGCGLFLVLLFIAVLIIVFRYRKTRKKRMKANRNRKKISEPKEEDNELELVSNVLYISADDLDDKEESPNVETHQNLQTVNDSVYSFVKRDNDNAEGNSRQVYSFVRRDKLNHNAEGNSRQVYSFVRRDNHNAEGNSRQVYSFVRRDNHNAEGNSRQVYSFVRRDNHNAEGNSHQVYSFVKTDHDSAESSSRQLFSFVNKDNDNAEGNSRQVYSFVKKDSDSAVDSQSRVYSFVKKDKDDVDDIACPVFSFVNKDEDNTRGGVYSFVKKDNDSAVDN
uniref:Uncharacterized protein LOC111122960 n=1 Tax=Crassostrea virginica TaxID=6565 RepID=A0A8B8CZN6_CRAVI|nr:uncharacterized protein LOC111122960 [Crassostrea virginica]